MMENEDRSYVVGAIVVCTLFGSGIGGLIVGLAWMPLQ